MSHHRRYHWLFGAVLVSLTMLNVARSAFAQAPGRGPKVTYFARPETSAAPRNEVVRGSVEPPQQSNASHEEVPSTGVRPPGGTENLNGVPPPPSKPVVLQFGQSSRSHTRQAAGALGSVDARPVLSRAINARPADPRPASGDGSLLVQEHATDLRAIDGAPPRAIPARLANASRPNWNASAVAAETAFADPADAGVPQLLTELTSVRVTSHSDWKPTAKTGRTPPSARHREVELATTRPDSWDEVRTTQSTTDDETGLAAAESNVPLTWVSRPRSAATAVSSDSHPGRFLPRVAKDVTDDDPEPPPSAATIPFPPNSLRRNDHLMDALIGGIVLLLGGLFGIVIFTLTRIGRQREPLLKVDIIINGSGAGMAGAASANSQSVTMPDSRLVNHNNPLNRVPPSSKPAARGYSPPAPPGYSQSVAPVYTRSVAPTTSAGLY